MKISKCPYCGFDYGLYVSNKVNIDVYYDFEGNKVGQSEPTPLTKRKRIPVYCQVCNKYVGDYNKLFKK